VPSLAAPEQIAAGAGVAVPPFETVQAVTPVTGNALITAYRSPQWHTPVTPDIEPVYDQPGAAVAYPHQVRWQS